MLGKSDFDSNGNVKAEVLAEIKAEKESICTSENSSVCVFASINIMSAIDTQRIR